MKSQNLVCVFLSLLVVVVNFMSGCKINLKFFFSLEMIP